MGDQPPWKNRSAAKAMPRPKQPPPEPKAMPRPKKSILAIEDTQESIEASLISREHEHAGLIASIGGRVGWHVDCVVIHLSNGHTQRHGNIDGGSNAGPW